MKSYLTLCSHHFQTLCSLLGYYEIHIFCLLETILVSLYVRYLAPLSCPGHYAVPLSNKYYVICCLQNIVLDLSIQVLDMCCYSLFSCFSPFRPVLYLKYVNSESNKPPFWLSLYFLVPPVIHNPSHNILPAVPTIPAQNAPILDSGIMTTSHKHPARFPGLASTNATFLVPDYVRKKFAEGWNVHVPLTFLMDKGCLTKDKPTAGAAQEILTLDNTGHIQTSSKPFMTMEN